MKNSIPQKGLAARLALCTGRADGALFSFRTSLAGRQGERVLRPEHMQKLRALVFVTGILLADWSSNASDTAQVSGIIDGKALRLSASMQHELAEESVRVLRSCTYANLHPAGEYASTVAHAKERSYLQVAFSEPQLVELSVGK